MADNLLRVIYKSNASGTLSTDDLSEIARISGHNNRKLMVTGFLTLSNSIFVQYLEGFQEQVDLILEKIICDTRHQNIKIFRLKSSPARRFPNWQMRPVSSQELIGLSLENVLEQVVNLSVLKIIDDHCLDKALDNIFHKIRTLDGV